MSSAPANSNNPQAAWTGRLSLQFFRSVTAVALAGLLISLWLRAYTDCFEGVASLLSLGGVFVWLAYVWSAIEDDRQKDIKAVIAQCFDNRWTERIALSILAASVVVSLFFGGVRVENLQGGDATVRVYEGSKPAEQEDDRLPVGGAKNFPHFFPCPFGSAEVHIKVDGLPVRKQTIKPWWRSVGANRVQIPGSFLRPVVLIGAATWQVVNADEAKHKLIVTVNCKEFPMSYNGRAVLVGAVDKDLPMPAGLPSLPGWNVAFNTSKVVVRLMPPIVAVGTPNLRPGDQISAKVVDTTTQTVLAESWPITLAQPLDRSTIILPVLLSEKEGR